MCSLSQAFRLSRSTQQLGSWESWIVITDNSYPQIFITGNVWCLLSGRIYWNIKILEVRLDRIPLGLSMNMNPIWSSLGKVDHPWSAFLKEKTLKMGKYFKILWLCSMTVNFVNSGWSWKLKSTMAGNTNLYSKNVLNSTRSMHRLFLQYYFRCNIFCLYGCLWGCAIYYNYI